MYYDTFDIVFQEVPNEISLAFRFTGCPLRCPGCHSESTKLAKGNFLDVDGYIKILEKYRHSVSCVLFIGGEWNPRCSEYLEFAKMMGYKTCLYTGLSSITDKLRSSLTYLKTGPWVESLGGLDSVHTNQRFVDLRSGDVLNHLFRKNEK